jgi:hypothetical protein
VPEDFDRFTALLAGEQSRRRMLGFLGWGAIAGVAGGRLPLARMGRGRAGAQCHGQPCTVQYPAQNLQDCPCRREHPGYKATSNGCGPAGVLNLPKWALIPDSIAYISFKSACDHHDICYGTCNQTKTKCDDALGDEIYDSCVATYPVSDGSSLNPFTAFQQAMCNGLGNTYVWGVSGTGGDEAYDAAQKEACECCFPVTQVYCPCNDTCYDDAAVCLNDCPVSLGCFNGICAPATGTECPGS